MAIKEAFLWDFEVEVTLESNLYLLIDRCLPISNTSSIPLTVQIISQAEKRKRFNSKKQILTLKEEEFSQKRI